MKLWLQVLFAQGYLWRDRFPDMFGRDAHLRGERPSLWQVAFGLFWVAAAALVLVYDPSLWAAVYLTVGICFSLPLLRILRVDRIVGHGAFWVSLWWATGVLTLCAVLAFAVALAVFGYWVGALVFLGFLVFPAAPTINGIFARYLFFADPEANADILEEYPISNFLSFWLDTFWRLPRAAAMTTFHTGDEQEPNEVRKRACKS